jgi:hypothetical protein
LLKSWRDFTHNDLLLSTYLQVHEDLFPDRHRLIPALYQPVGASDNETDC